MEAQRHLDPEQQLTNVEEYGEACPWEQINSHPVFTVELESAEGKEVKLRLLCTFKHTHTDEVEKSLTKSGSITFAFHDEFTDGGSIVSNGREYEPFAEITA